MPCSSSAEAQAGVLERLMIDGKHHEANSMVVLFFYRYACKSSRYWPASVLMLGGRQAVWKGLRVEKGKQDAAEGDCDGQRG